MTAVFMKNHSAYVNGLYLLNGAFPPHLFCFFIFMYFGSSETGSHVVAQIFSGTYCVFLIKLAPLQQSPCLSLCNAMITIMNHRTELFSAFYLKNLQSIILRGNNSEITMVFYFLLLCKSFYIAVIRKCKHVILYFSFCPLTVTSYIEDLILISLFFTP